jgi:uracil-DNA glycosylase
VIEAVEPAVSSFSVQVPVITDVPFTGTLSMETLRDPSLVSTLEGLEKSIAGCVRCKLHKGRKNIVFGSGNPKAQLMFVGESPGEQEDQAGLPFVGPAGDLLSKMIVAMKLKREDVYFANVVKCKPPLNRSPDTDEMHECTPFLKAQIRIVNPKVIVVLGNVAAQMILKTDVRLMKLRGNVHESGGRKVIATFHPSYLLKNPSEKKSAWDDLKLVMKELQS